MLLAVDGNQRIVGANRAARTPLLDDRGLQTGPQPVDDIRTRPSAVSTQGQRPIFATRLIDRRQQRALARAGDAAGKRFRCLAECDERCRAARASLATALQVWGTQRGAASARRFVAGAMRRVREYVDAHLGESMDLADAGRRRGTVGISFRASDSSNPSASHRTTISCRGVSSGPRTCWRARIFSLSEIAYAAGFSDQSHWRVISARCSARPGEFRWSQRQQRSVRLKF